MHKARKFSAVFGTASACNSKVILPASLPSIATSKNTCGFLAEKLRVRFLVKPENLDNGLKAVAEEANMINKIKPKEIVLENIGQRSDRNTSKTTSVFVPLLHFLYFHFHCKRNAIITNYNNPHKERKKQQETKKKENEIILTSKNFLFLCNGFQFLNHCLHSTFIKFW